MNKNEFNALIAEKVFGYRWVYFYEGDYPLVPHCNSLVDYETYDRLIGSGENDGWYTGRLSDYGDCSPHVPDYLDDANADCEVLARVRDDWSIERQWRFQITMNQIWLRRREVGHDLGIQSILNYRKGDFGMAALTALGVDWSLDEEMGDDKTD